MVTGAGSSGPGVGTGKAISILFAREGAGVLLVDNEKARAEETLASIEEEGGTASVFEGDVTNSADCQRMAEAAVERYGRLDILVNNVGIVVKGNVVTINEEDWQRVIDVNLKSMVLTSKHAVPRMIEGGGGSIINMSSFLGVRSGSAFESVPYSASKGGILSLTTTMAVEHGRDNVRVNAIVPGYLYTPMVAGSMDEEHGGHRLGRRLGVGVPGQRRGPVDYRRRVTGRRRSAGHQPAGNARPPALARLSRAPRPQRLTQELLDDVYRHRHRDARPGDHRIDADQAAAGVHHRAA